MRVCRLTGDVRILGALIKHFQELSHLMEENKW